MRARAALFLCLLLVLASGFGLSFLLALGERDWFHCFAHGESDRPPLPSLFAPGELTPVLLETLTPPFSHPLLFTLHFGAGLAFGLFFWLSKSSRQRHAILVSWLLFHLLCLFLLLPVDIQHHCDRKGTDGVSTLLLLAPFGGLLASITFFFFRKTRTSP